MYLQKVKSKTTKILSNLNDIQIESQDFGKEIHRLIYSLEPQTMDSYSQGFPSQVTRVNLTLSARMQTWKSRSRSVMPVMVFFSPQQMYCISALKPDTENSMLLFFSQISDPNHFDADQKFNYKLKTSHKYKNKEAQPLPQPVWFEQNEYR